VFGRKRGGGGDLSPLTLSLDTFVQVLSKVKYCVWEEGGGEELFYVIHIPLQCFSCFSLVYLHICVLVVVHMHIFLLLY